ncbi:carbohydrate ABC transporter permease [Caldicellulosiruptoraceae bacterium PP1]
MKKGNDYIIFNVIAYTFISLLALFTLLPFVIMIMSSFASEHYIINHGYTLFPKEFSLNAYQTIFQNPQRIFRAYGVTLFVTIIGTSISLFLSSMAAYVMYRKDVKYRNGLAFFLYFTTLFNGGLAPYYLILTNYYHLKDSILVLILVPMFSVFNILILRNFIKGSIPESLVESAKIDGAGDFRIFIRIILPLSKPALASIGLFTALNYWNDWWTPMMFIEKQNLFPLQYTLYLILSSVNIAANILSHVTRFDMPKETIKLAMTVVATGPIILLYPFVQRYFVKGITLGAVKG